VTKLLIGLRPLGFRLNPRAEHSHRYAVVAVSVLIAGALVATGIFASSHLNTVTTTLTETSTTTQSATQYVAFSVSTTSALTSSQTSGQSVEVNVTSASSQSPPEVKISVGEPSINYGGASFGGMNTTLIASEVLPLTVTSPTDLKVNLTAQGVPFGVWVRFTPSELTAAPDGTPANMTISGGAEQAGPFSNKTMLVGASYGSASTLVPFAFVQLFNVSILQSPTSPVEFPNSMTTTNDSLTVSPYAVVYAPSSSEAPSATVGISVLGTLAKNGTVMSMPSWLRVTVSNASLSLPPDQPEFFIVAVNTTASAPDGTYQIAIGERTAGGNEAVVPLEVIVASIQGGSMGMSDGM
jgi:hypothetical protein